MLRQAGGQIDDLMIAPLWRHDDSPDFLDLYIEPGSYSRPLINQAFVYSKMSYTLSGTYLDFDKQAVMILAGLAQVADLTIMKKEIDFDKKV